MKIESNLKNSKRSYIREILDATNKETISFAGGLPNAELFDLKKIKDASIEALQDSSSLQYSSSIGVEELREEIASYYNKYFDFKTSKDEILITTGSQQAFDLIGKTFIKNEVVVQSPTYIGALSSFKILDLKIKEFVDINELSNKLKKQNALYCMSDFINPTGKSYSKEERTEIIDILNIKKSYLIEDGAYSFLSFDGKIEKPLCASYEKSFHLGSFSKIVAPGLRIGWIRADRSLINELLIAKESVDLHTPTITQNILVSYLKNNDLFTHIKKVKKDYENKMEFMSACFKKYIPSFVFEKPKGGMFIYGKFDEDSFILAKKALLKNIAFVPGSVFYVNSKKSNEARFNYTNTNKKQTIKAIKELGKLVNTQDKQTMWFNMFLKLLKNKKILHNFKDKV